MFTKINSCSGNFEGRQKKEGGAAGVEDRRVPPRAPGISHHSFISSFHFPSFLSVYLPVPASTILFFLIFAAHQYSTVTASALHVPPTATVRTASCDRPVTTRLEQLFRSVHSSAIQPFLHLSFFDDTSTRLPYRSAHPYRHTNACAILERNSPAQYVA